jgi:hypothetical protein
VGHEKPDNKSKERTPIKRHIVTPVETFVKSTSAETLVAILFPSVVIATGPEVYNGAMERAFLNLYTY